MTSQDARSLSIAQAILLILVLLSGGAVAFLLVPAQFEDGLEVYGLMSSGRVAAAIVYAVLWPVWTMTVILGARWLVGEVNQTSSPELTVLNFLWVSLIAGSLVAGAILWPWLNIEGGLRETGFDVDSGPLVRLPGNYFVAGLSLLACGVVMCGATGVARAVAKRWGSRRPGMRASTREYADTMPE